jgi:hypothetical protein
MQSSEKKKKRRGGFTAWCDVCKWFTFHVYFTRGFICTECGLKYYLPEEKRKEVINIPG